MKLSTELRTLGRRYAALGLALPFALLAGCSSASQPSRERTTQTTAETGHPHEASEAAAVTPRLLLTYDGGIEVLDATTLETISALELDGSNRLNSAGDGRNALVSTTAATARRPRS